MLSFYTAGPLASILIYKFGYRVAILIGGLIGAGGLIICSEAYSILTVFLSYGALAGEWCISLRIL